MPEQAEWVGEDEEDYTYPPVQRKYIVANNGANSMAVHLPDVRTGPEKLAAEVHDLAVVVAKLNDRLLRLEAAHGMVSDA